MSFLRYRKKSLIAAPVEDVFAWHARPGAIERLTPPWESVRLIKTSGHIAVGAEVLLSAKIGMLRKTWLAKHTAYEKNRFFRDEMISGPFKSWIHEHHFDKAGDKACHLEDDVRYALPLGFLGKLWGRRFAAQKIARMFDYRHRVTAMQMADHLKYGGGNGMKILVTGAHGLVGSALIPFLTTEGYLVRRLVRTNAREEAGDILWSPELKQVDPAKLEGFDAVIHLAGENIAAERWTEEQKRKIRDSRVIGTKFLSETLVSLKSPPKVFIAASATGYYGAREGEVVTEESLPGEGFLADVCREWEAVTEPAAKKNIRVVNARFGIILSPNGGALQKMLPPFRLGVGGKLGSGRQIMSWIALDDVVAGLYHVLNTADLKGPVNFVSPQSLTNRDFTKALGAVLKRPTIFPVPALVIKILFGEMGEALLLSGANVEPRKLLESGYTFHFPELKEALHHLLGK